MNRSLTPEELKTFSPENPFCDGRFFQLLERSHLIGKERGQEPLSFLNDKAATYSYIKTHSFGEYIFDWAWADFYKRYGKEYYPKLVHALPFTPVNAPKILGKNVREKQSLLKETQDFYLSHPHLTGHHFLFTTQEENELLENHGYKIQKSFQFHWANEWKDFDEFLQSLKSRKRKQIKKERRSVSESHLHIERKKAHELEQSELKEIFSLYMSTIEKKYSLAYLNWDFFQLLPELFPDDAFFVLAKEADEIVAMSLFFYSQKTLYGRYWGVKKETEQESPYLHFELCYYQGMEFCFEHGLKRFEAGAQGEHKLLRGFSPVITTSAHHLKDSPFNQVVYRHIEEQSAYVENLIRDFSQHLPYKSPNDSK